MELVVGIALMIGVSLGGLRFLKAFREARDWKELYAGWGPEQSNYVQKAFNALQERGIQVKIRTIGILDFGRLYPQRLTSIRVHRNDYVEATMILRAITKG